MAIISLENPALQSYIFYSAVLALKLLAVAILTGVQRFKKNVFANPEDAARKGAKVKLDDPDVERMRRAHLNDLENIPPFWILGALYLTTGPTAFWATILFRVFAISRIIHTYVYAVKQSQPARGISHLVSYFINIYLGVQVVLHYSSAL